MTAKFRLDAFEERIGVTSSGAVTLERLESLHRAHVYTVPFENLDIQLDRGIDVSAEAIDAKVIDRRRGGYCFELNDLFARALEAAGFQVRRLLARVHLSGEPSGRSHQLSLVELGGRQFIVDVGFGTACLRAPLPLEMDTERQQDVMTFRLVEHPLGHMLQQLNEDGWRDLYSFDMAPVVPNDIAYANHYTSTSPLSFFTTSRMATLCHPDGEVRLFNYRCTRARNGVTEVEMWPDSQAYLERLRQTFGIELDAPYESLRPVVDRA